MEDNLKNIIELLANKIESKELSSSDMVGEKDSNPFFENEFWVLYGLINQSYFCQTSDKISMQAVNLLKDVNKKDLAVEYILENLNKIYLFSEGIDYSFTNEFFIKHILNGNLSHFFDKYFVKHEGHSCSSDKESFVVNKIKQSLVENKELDLYSEYDFGEGLVKAYWSPETINNTKEAKDLFEKWFYKSV